jgi:hypothetical protein
MIVTLPHGLVVAPDMLYHTGFSSILLDVEAWFILSFPSSSFHTVKKFIFLISFYCVFFTSKKYLQKRIAGKLLTAFMSDLARIFY